MTKDQAELLLQSLLNRVAADPGRYRGLISEQEETAIQLLVGPVAPVDRAVTGDGARPRLPMSGGREPINSVLIATEETSVVPNIILCLDFGTAKSKACAAEYRDGDEPISLELGIGRLDNDIDGSVFCAASSVWVDDSSKVFVGSDAIRKGVQSGDPDRARIDSIKNFVSQATRIEEVQTTLLTEQEDPFQALTQEHALLFYLGYLTDLALTTLADRGFPRNIRRRFALPCWDVPQRAWASKYLGELVARAQILADTFHGQWGQGIDVRDLLAVCAASAAHVNRLRYLLDETPDIEAEYAQRWAGVLEPIASASTRVWRDKFDRRLTLIVDIGAGTTDVALFWIVQNEKGKLAFPIARTSRALRMAGDHLDEILVRLMLERGHIDRRLRARAEAKLRIEGLRGLKERIYEEGSLKHRLLNDAEVLVTCDEFEQNPDVLALRNDLQTLIQQVLAGLSESWQGHADRVNLVLSGGGAKLPMAKDLANLTGTLGSTKVRFRLAPLVPPNVEPAIHGDYPQLAVALGGCLNVVQERYELDEFPGSNTPPGDLERYQTKGI